MALRGLVFYTVNEVSDIMQVRVETVLRWIYAKKIKASKLPGSRIWRIREEDIIDFMDRGANTRNDFHEHEDIHDIHDDDIEEHDLHIEEDKPLAAVTKDKAKDSIVINKSDIVKMKDGDYVTADKLRTGNEKVVDEFVFDEEQAKKPIEEEITLVSLEHEKVHICDDQEVNASIMKKNNIVIE